MFRSIVLAVVFFLLSENVLNAKEWDKVLFVEANAGYSFLPYRYSGNKEEINPPDEYGIAYGGGIGFRASDNYFFTLNYTQQDLESVEFTSYYASANFRFRFRRSAFAPYVGLLAGMSTMHWKKLPVASQSPVDDSNAFMWGFQVGDEYLLTRWLQLYGAYQYTNAMHETEIVGMGVVKYQANNALILGLKISFIDPN